MTVRKTLLALFLLTCSVLSAASYQIVLGRPTTVGSTVLRPGNYTLQVENGKAQFKSGSRILAEAAVTIETAPSKFDATALMYTPDAKLKSVSIKGTTSTFVLAN